MFGGKSGLTMVAQSWVLKDEHESRRPRICVVGFPKEAMCRGGGVPQAEARTGTHTFGLTGVVVEKIPGRRAGLPESGKHRVPCPSV